jgi:uncharacterized protein YlxW (UPF0749 family)
VTDERPTASAAAGNAVHGTASVGMRVAVAAALGLLMVILVNANRAAPVEARIGQRVEIVELIRAEQQRNEALAARVEELAAELAALEQQQSGASGVLDVLSAEVGELTGPAGMTPVGGPGVTVTLRDSRIAPPADGDFNNYVIHEQDLQAVINGLWAGGAEAVSVNGNRILSTTAIRCVGNVLLLHGVTHSPPYVIEAIGDESELRAAVERDPGVATFVDAVSRYQLGYTIDSVEDLVLPGYEGLSTMQNARPVAAVGA